jgi:glycerol uptake facilitator-like aquaporin
VIPYVGAQVAGSILASFSLRLLLGRAARVGATLPAGSASQSLVLEILLSFILMFVVSAVATDTRAVSNTFIHSSI